MLTIYQSDSSGQLQTVSNIVHNTLLYLVDPTDAEISQISNKLNIPENFIRDSLDINERPRIEKDDSSMVIILNSPVAMNEERLYEEIPYRTIPIGIIHVKDHLVIVTKKDNSLCNDIFLGKYGTFQTHMKTRITLLLFEAIAQSYLDFLKRIKVQVGRLQQELKESHNNRELFGLININKGLVYFSTSLRAMRNVFLHLSKGQDIKLYDEDEKMLHNALVDLEQAAEVTEMRSLSLSNLMDAYAAITHNNLNSVLKILTTITIVLMIPTILGSIFAMNVPLPFEDQPFMFVVILGLMAGISGGLVYVFYKTKFLRF
ncbi:magnesium transporter CorA family protein [Lysinibacillus xylanilyticus]|uniref:magnesium transporter CorA family protein n=1 Tax=Lysinibacillus xylanilyticus TaxID=582475 RepID=UPI002B2532F4|nr:magnesium transporter CorA family protein [Lysinibacillus xylanilyticus]MEB2299921.1 magnesium transporter CorA family protein [Lysinibacillus xylanilyticus]